MIKLVLKTPKGRIGERMLARRMPISPVPYRAQSIGSLSLPPQAVLQSLRLSLSLCVSHKVCLPFSLWIFSSPPALSRCLFLISPSRSLACHLGQSVSVHLLLSVSPSYDRSLLPSCFAVLCPLCFCHPVSVPYTCPLLTLSLIHEPVFSQWLHEGL